MEKTGNLFDITENISSKQEIEETLIKGNKFLFERIVSSGQISPDGFWYIQKNAEWVSVIKGKGEIEFEGGGKIMLHTGDFFIIEAMKKHRVSYTSEDCIWLALHFKEK